MAERGLTYTLSQAYYGDEKEGIKPNATFVEEMNKKPKLWEIAQKIEGLICGYSIHAGGIIFNDEPFTHTCSLMKAPDGTVISNFELHDAEKCSLIKYDALSVEAMDKIQVCLELLQEHGFIKSETTLKETYEKVIGIYNLERDVPDMWKMVWEHKIISLFQMEQQSGIDGIAKTKPTSVDDLAVLNSVIRLMAQEKGGEIPTDKYARFKSNPKLWELEMDKYGLTKEEKILLHKELDISYGLSISQEQFMMLVQIPEIGGFDLQWADRLRKSIAKKNPKEYDQLTKEFFENMKEKKLSENLCSYVWNVLIAMNRGYGFNAAHTLGYSLVGLQEMNLAYNYPIIFWNTANLIVDSAGIEYDDEIDETEGHDVETEEEPEEEIVDIYEPEEWEGYEYEDLPDRSGKKKKKVKTVDFGKIATSIGKFQSEGIEVSPPDINKSGFTFTPDVENNRIASGLRNITRISADLVTTIIQNRPYTSVQDFRNKVKVNKTQMLQLLKCGAFDNLVPDRLHAIDDFIADIAGQKNNLTLANLPTLMKYNVLEGADEYCELYSYNRFIRKYMDEDKTIITFPNEKTLEYYCDHFDIDKLLTENSILVKTWEKQYKAAIAPLSDYIKSEKEDLMKRLNRAIVEEQLGIYANGNISKYEMESMGFYYHAHELQNIDPYRYDLVRFTSLPEEPVVDKVFPSKDGGEIKLFKLNHICGTVLNKNKLKGTVTLLTTDGVVNVKVWKSQFAKYDKQISKIGDDGHKHVLEKSWFSRGNLLYIQGIRRGDSFIPKAYKNSWHKNPIMKITEVNNNDITIVNDRVDDDE